MERGGPIAGQSARDEGRKRKEKEEERERVVDCVLVLWWKTVVLFLLPKPCPVRCGTLNTPPHDQHYWAWFVDINGGWPDNGNLIAGGPADLGGGSDTILEIVVGPNTTPQNRLGMKANTKISIAWNRTRVSWVKARYPNRWTTMKNCRIKII
ncbi:hypothetical protein MTR_6g015030 [Medicago truncatula]|uniref:Uncharacterized protein n=1 Tax=Medicago truncatula TaxID=3880 RepID=G7KMP5_MEDTR|nr:hypothetical protein MTR_6g015030 [Medicago truncatula]